MIGERSLSSRGGWSYISLGFGGKSANSLAREDARVVTEGCFPYRGICLDGAG